MLVKFNPTGTHVHKGFLKVRVDLYPAVGDKTYDMNYVDIDEGNPTGEKKLNPCLCHFIKIDPNITLASLEGIVRGIFNKNTLGQLDEALSKGKVQVVSKTMVSRSGKGTKLPAEVDGALIDSLNTRFAGLEIEV